LLGPKQWPLLRFVAVETFEAKLFPTEFLHPVEDGAKGYTRRRFGGRQPL
jgi:hypothetical protein